MAERDTVKIDTRTGELLRRLTEREDRTQVSVLRRAVVAYALLTDPREPELDADTIRRTLANATAAGMFDQLEEVPQ